MQVRGTFEETVEVIEEDIDEIIDSFQVPEENNYTKQVFIKAQEKERLLNNQSRKQFNSTNFQDEEEQIQLLFTNLDTGQSSTLSLKEVDEVNQSCFLKNKEIKTNEKGGAWYQFWKKVHKSNQQLRAASERGDVKYVSNAVENRSSDYPLDINSRGFDQWTALHFASCEDHIEVVELLLKYGADINAETRFGRTALHISALRGNLKIIQLLVSKGIDIDHQDEDGNTALHIATQNEYKEIVQCLIQSNARIIRNNNKLSPLDLVKNVGQKIKEVFQKNNVKISELESKISETSETSPSRKPAKNTITKRMLQSMELNTDSFIYYKLLGTGSFGQVFLVKPKNQDQLYAMKVLKKEQIFSRNLIKYAFAERNVLSTMNHPFIVKLNYSFQSETKLFLIMDYCSGGDLGTVLKKRKSLPENEVRMYVCELVLAFQALHKNMIIYRDLKPDNVVLDEEGHVRLTDFGLSKQGVYNNSTQSFCGSIAYLAPQILTKQGHTRMVDWYLLGVLTFELLTGIPPYYSNQKEQLFKNIKQGTLKIPKGMNSISKDFIMKLLHRDPKKRLGYNKDASEIRQHPFFEGINWVDAMNRQLPVPKVETAKINMNQTIKVEFSSKKQTKRENVDRWTYINST